MAKFIVNSSNTIAIRKEQVASISIQTVSVEQVTEYRLRVKMDVNFRVPEIVFDTDTTLEGIEAKATTLLAALEE